MPGASAYGAAFVGVADVLTGASADAAYEVAYGKYYTAFSQMKNASRQRSAAEANIASLAQSRINTNKVIAMQQDRAEAQTKVLAAVSGTEGQSVQDVIYQSETNSSVAKSNALKATNRQIEQQLSSIYQSTTTMLAADNPPIEQSSILMDVARGASTITQDKQSMSEIGDWIDNF